MKRSDLTNLDKDAQQTHRPDPVPDSDAGGISIHLDADTVAAFKVAAERIANGVRGIAIRDEPVCVVAAAIRVAEATWTEADETGCIFGHEHVCLNDDHDHSDLRGHSRVSTVSTPSSASSTARCQCFDPGATVCYAHPGVTVTGSSHYKPDPAIHYYPDATK